MAGVTHSRHDLPDGAVDAVLGDDLDFGRYVVAMWRRRWLILLVGVVCGAVAAAAALVAAPMYQASSTLAVTESKLDNTGSSVQLGNFPPLIQNNSVAAQVVREFGLVAAPHRISPEALLEGVTVDEIRNTNLLRVNVRLRDPALAARVANRMAELAVEGAVRLNNSQVSGTRDELASEVSQAKKRMEEAALRLEQFQNSAQVELAKEDVKAMLEQRSGLQKLAVDIEALRAKVRRGEAELAARRRVDTLTKAINNDPAALEAARTVAESTPPLELQLKSEEISRSYEAIDEQLASDRADLSELEARRKQLLDVRKLGAARQPMLADLYRKERTLSQLTTEYEVAEASYREIARTHDVARLQMVSRSAQLQIIDHAITPSDAVPRHVVRNAVFAMLAGATLMALAVVLAQGLRDALGS